MVRTELYTSGGEFALPDGTTYIGAYHIHDIQGPMTGAFHKETPHDSLTPLNRRTEVFVQTIIQQLRSNTVSSTMSSGSGGGGGY
tara:strand:- start:35 stop:289 length:255 start_codon:yes stop_codon:yes gene_type:complete